MTIANNIETILTISVKLYSLVKAQIYQWRCIQATGIITTVMVI